MELDAAPFALLRLGVMKLVLVAYKFGLIARRGGFDKNPPTATPVAPVQTHSRVKSRTRTHRVSGHSWV
jgi:hypothetical protein